MRIVLLATCASFAFASGAQAHLLIPALCDALETTDERATCYMSHPEFLAILYAIGQETRPAIEPQDDEPSEQNGED